MIFLVVVVVAVECVCVCVCVCDMVTVVYLPFTMCVYIFWSLNYSYFNPQLLACLLAC